MNFDVNFVRGALTLTLLLAFVLLIYWTAHPRNKHRFDAAARTPLEDDAPDAPKEQAP